MDAHQEHVLMAYMLKQYNKLEENTWLFNSGATRHLTNETTGVYNIVKIAVTKDHTNISTKLDTSRRVCMYLRYSEAHTQKVYRFVNLNMKRLCTVKMYNGWVLCMVNIWV